MGIRSLIVLLLALALTPTARAEEPAAATAAEEVVRGLAKRLRAERPTAKTDPTDWTMRPERLARRAFGGVYEALPPEGQRTVDVHVWFLMTSHFEDFVKGRAAPDSFITTAESDGTHRVVAKFGRRSFSFVVAPPAANGARYVVDVGSMGQSLATTLRTGAIGIEDGEKLIEMLARVRSGAERKMLRRRAEGNIRSIVTMFVVMSATRSATRWPAYGGRRFVLSIVAHGVMSVDTPGGVAVFYSPSTPISQHAAPKAYTAVTPDALRTKRDFSGLTSYAGRRNDEPKYAITEKEAAEGAIIVADLSIPDLVIAGYTDGRVRVLTREDLGLGPKDPLVVGDAAKNKELRKLSLK